MIGTRQVQSAQMQRKLTNNVVCESGKFAQYFQPLQSLFQNTQIKDLYELHVWYFYASDHMEYPLALFVRISFILQKQIPVALNVPCLFVESRIRKQWHPFYFVPLASALIAPLPVIDFIPPYKSMSFRLRRFWKRDIYINSKYLSISSIFLFCTIRSRLETEIYVCIWGHTASQLNQIRPAFRTLKFLCCVLGTQNPHKLEHLCLWDCWIEGKA